MSAEGVHHTIETLQREVEALRSAATNPAQSQGVLLEAFGAFRSMLEELHVAEVALRHQAQLLELSYEPIFVWDLEQGIVLWNQGCERLYGFTQAEAIGRVSHELLHTVHPVSFTEFYAALVHDQQWTGELRQTTRDGHEVIVDSRHQLLERDGRWLVLEANRDITARKQAEAALRDSESRACKV